MSNILKFTQKNEISKIWHGDANWPMDSIAGSKF